MIQLRTISHKERVEFSLFCAKKCINLINSRNNISNCIRSVENWLKDPSYENQEACRKAANTINHDDTCNITRSATIAIANAAYTIIYHFNDTYSSVYAASNALKTSKETLFKEWMNEKLWNLIESA